MNAEKLVPSKRLRPLREERSMHLAYFDPSNEYVPNPGMGVHAYVFSDHMHVGYDNESWSRTEGQPQLSLDRQTFERMVSLPYTDNLYIRVEWCDIQKQPGRLELPDAWKWMLEAAEKRNKKWSFRIMNSSPHSMKDSSIPEFLKGRLGMVPYWCDGLPEPKPKFIMTYDDEYLKWWGEMLQLLGSMFDDHPLLEYADISGYGLWGEAHHYARFKLGEPPTDYCSEWKDRVDLIIERLISDHLAAFPKTPAALNMHMAYYEAGRSALEQGLCWLRRDSFMPIFSTCETEYAVLAGQNGAMVWETILPGCGTESHGKVPELGFMNIPLRYFDIGACYAAVGFNPWDVIYAHETYPQLYDIITQNLGYRLRPAIIWRRKIGNGPQEIVVGMRNDGCASPPGEISLQVKFPGGNMQKIILPRNEPRPGRIELYAVPMPLECEGYGPENKIKLSLTLRMKGKSHPIQWAVKKQQADDSYELEVPLYQFW